MFVGTVQAYPNQYRSNRSACFLPSQTPSPPYCRGGAPPPASRRRRSGRRNEAGWPWSYREADGTASISRLNNHNTVIQSFLCWTVPTVPGSKRALMSSKTSATRMAKDRLAWMWYRWLRMVLTELKRGGTLLRLINTVRWNVMKWRYSRQNSKGDQGDGEAEDGNGAANITNGCQRHLVASSELHRETGSSTVWSVITKTIIILLQYILYTCASFLRFRKLHWAI